MYKHDCAIENADAFVDWIKNRGGVAVWNSRNLSNPGRSLSTPNKTKEGEPFPSPDWQVGSSPDLIITDPKEIEVHKDKEVKRFHVAIRQSSNGLMLKCTDASSRRIRKAVEKAGRGAHHTFDYASQEAVILVPEVSCSLQDHMEGKCTK